MGGISFLLKREGKGTYAWPLLPTAPAAEEMATKKSRGVSFNALWKFHAPLTLDSMTLVYCSYSIFSKRTSCGN